MKILIADAFPPRALTRLSELGCEVDYRPKLKAEELAGAVGDASVLVVRSTEVPKACIEAGRALSLIVRAGAGVNTIDIKAANARGIYVTNCPGKNAIAVAELTMGLLLAVDRRIAENVADLRGGRWNKGEYSKADGLYGKTMGIVGAGQIGREVMTRAKAFGLKVVVWSRSITAEEAERWGVMRAASLDDLLTRCDIISLHVALTPETRGMIGREALARMKSGAILLNAARAEVVDEAAVVEAVEAGRVRYGTDVFAGEPEEKSGTFTSRLASLPGVIGTHHIGASTEQAQDAVADEVVRIVDRYKRFGEVPNWVNRQRTTAATWQLVVRHFDRPGVLANVLAELKAAGINVQEVENVVFEGALTACCTLRLSARPAPGVMDAIAARKDEVISVLLSPL